jgi:hypothetical protein
MKYKRFRRKAKYLFRKLGVVETCRKYSVVRLYSWKKHDSQGELV